MKSASIRALAASLALSAAWAPALFSPLTAQDSNTVMEPEFEAENDPFIWLEEARSVPELYSFGRQDRSQILIFGVMHRVL